MNIEVLQQIAIGDWPDAREEFKQMARELLFAHDTLASIRLYANGTLSGPSDGSDDREWHRDAVIEIRNRCRKALNPPKPEAIHLNAEERTIGKTHDARKRQ